METHLWNPAAHDQQQLFRHLLPGALKMYRFAPPPKARLGGAAQQQQQSKKGAVEDEYK